MHRILSTLSIAAWVICFLSAKAAKADSSTIAWKQIVNADPSSLSADQKSRVEKNLSSLQNTYGCEGTVAECMKRGDLTARRNAGFIVRAVKKEKDDAYIAKYLALRKESAHPKEKAKLDLKESPLHGKASAPIVFTAFECFQCPFCAHLAPQIKALHLKFKDKIAEYYKFFPLRSHPRGVAAAAAALAAQRQGKFWEMHDLLFENRANLEDEDLRKYASALKLDLAEFDTDFKDPSLLKIIEKDKLEGMRSGVDGTPTFFINGKRYQAAYDIDEIIDRIEEELDIVEGRISK